ncbi:MAG TPA: polyprenyl synthetase family protein [Thermodesulfobacteriota bacterium]|nr:polyprenyl synthetase family protein [Thermodesulfobacteriota bacterium]
MEFDIKSYIARNRAEIDAALGSLIPAPESPSTRLVEAVRYSLLAGGKRLRPILMIAACEAVGGDRRRAVPVACALEMIHTYSLIHDDLPSMDDDPLRRGIPTSHVVFGEATAILAGDALLTDAFRLIVTEGRAAGIDSAVICDIIEDMSAAAGSRGMIEGQALDLALEGRLATSLSEIESMHSLKTGALMRTAVTTGARIGGASDDEISALASYAGALGLAFQIRDDLLDLDAASDTGKAKGNDARRGKSTYPGLAGVDESRRKMSELIREAVSRLSAFDERAEPLRRIAIYLGGEG